MLKIPRLLIRQIRAMLRRAGLKPQKAHDHPVQIFAGAEGLTLRATTTDIAVSYHNTQALPSFSAVVPLSILAECEGRQKDLVTIAPGNKPKEFVVTWQEKNVPQQRVSLQDDLHAFDKFPLPQAALSENSPTLLNALADASETADTNAGRYALGCLQLQGEPGVVAATDGSQLLWQSGFSFPWTESLLVAGSRVFAAPELAKSGPVRIGQDGVWVFLMAGPWTIGLRIVKDARYPIVEQVFPKEAPTTTLHVPQPDREFLADSIPNLPSADEFHNPITLDLSGEIAVRAIGPEQSAPTELVLSGAHFEGQPVRMNVNRKLLRRAIQLGFESLQMTSGENIVLCESDAGPFQRKYVFMPLSKDAPVLSAPNALRTVSLSVGGDRPSTPSKDISHTPMPTTTTPTEANSDPATAEAKNMPAETKRAKKAAPSSLDQAVALRTALREAAAKANELVKALKRDQRQQRIVKETLRSLKQLQAA